MTLKEAQSILGRITYKPGSMLDLSEDFGGVLRLRAAVLVEDAEGLLNGKIPIIGYERFPREAISRFSEQQFMEVVRQVFVRLELHEVDEWLRLDGRHYRDPHPELKLELPKLTLETTTSGASGTFR